MRSSFRPLTLPAFPRLAFANLVNEIGNWLGEIALAVLVFDATDSALATAALFLGMQFMPALLAPPVVARMEGLGGRRSLPLLYATEAATFGTLGLLADNFVLAVVLVLASIDGALASSARALTRATAAAILAPARMLREGNAILNIGFTVGAAAGPALAGLVVATAGPRAALYADAVSFLFVAVLITTARRLPRAEPDTATVRERLARALGYVRERPLLKRLLGVQAAAFIFFAVVIPIEVVFAKETLDAGDGGYGALLASWGAGMVLGSFAFAALTRVSLKLLLVLSTAAIGAAYLATGAAPTLAVACAASVLGGFGNGIQWVGIVTAIQELTQGAYQARVIAFLESVASAMPGIGFVIGGGVAAIFDPRASYAVAGAGVLIVLAIGVLTLRRYDWKPELEGLDDIDPPAPTSASSVPPIADPHRPADTAV
jgi:MFS family permease